MRRVFSDYAYGPEPRAGCFWDRTCDVEDRPVLHGEVRADVVVIGAGFTGLNAALVLAKGGADVVVLEAEQPGFGASGRNGGFCCLGGGYAEDDWLDLRFGKAARRAWRAAEVAAVRYVEGLIAAHGWDVDRHSKGETLLAHRPMSFDLEARAIEENYGVAAEIAEAPAPGFGQAFYGALTVPIGFGLNPRKYLAGLLTVAEGAGARVFGGSRVTSIDAGRVGTDAGAVIAERVIIATNGYSSEDMPAWLAGRVMPAQSTVLVTEPLSAAQLAEAGWQSDQMCYDTRNLLHYFRLMPDRRFLFGMRGGVLSGASAEAAARQRVERDLARLFPAWAKVPKAGTWSGFVALARDRMPFVGPVPGTSALAALCFHGNGVAMGSYAGRLVGQFALGQDPRIPEVMQKPLARFPLGRFRRALMPPLYAAMRLGDGIG